MKWIKLSDQKPPKGKEVAILHKAHLKGLEPYILMAKFYPAENDEEDDSWSEQNTTCGCCQWFDSESVTHWCEVPEIPIETYKMTRDEFYGKTMKEQRKLIDDDREKQTEQ